MLECRDATDLAFDPRKDFWFESLPESGEQAWMARAKRRQQRDTYRLAIITSKFRGQGEPPAYAVEISMKDRPWTMRECTGEIEAALEDARRGAAASREQRIADAVADLMQAFEKEPMNKTAAVEFLRERVRGLTREQAREKMESEIPAEMFTAAASKPGPRAAKQPALKLVKNEPAKEAVVTKEI